MPKDNTAQPPADDQQPIVGTTPPPSSDSLGSSTPPSFDDSSNGSTPPQVSVLEDVVVPPMVTESSDSGSAAPVSDVVMPDNAPMETTHIASTPRKNSVKGRVIATILGLFLLVGGVGAGLYLVSQNQNIEEKAHTCSGPAYDSCRQTKGSEVCACQVCGQCDGRDDNPGTPGPNSCGSYTTSSSCGSNCSPSGYKCDWSSANGSCNTSSQPCTGGGGNEEVITPGLCDLSRGNLGVQCGSGLGSANCTFCLTSSSRTCNQVLAERQCDTGIGSGCAAITDAVNTYYCQGNPPPDTSTGCQENDPLPAGVGWNDADNNITGSFCGTVQVDDADAEGVVFCSRTDTSGCNSNPPPTNPPAPTPSPSPIPTPTPSPVPTPSPTPLITAQCQNVKAYSESWALLTSAQLTALRPTNKVNFCVTGVTTGGSFNKARFTINNVLQAETTTVRPGSTDFCQLYTIPSGTTTFNVTAQINHVTLGWK